MPNGSKPATPADRQARAREEAARLYQQAVAAHQAGRFDEADELYRRTIANDSQHSNAMQMRGVIRLQHGQFDEAVKLISRAVAVDPANGQAYSNLGTALMELKRYDEALEALRSAAKLQPDNPDVLGNFGRALRRRNHYAEAVDVYRRATELAPNRPGLFSALGVALAESGDFKGALEAHEQALAMAPDRADLRNNVAHVHRIMGENAKAEAAFREAVALDPNHGEFRLGLGRSLNLQGKIGEALDHYRAAQDAGVQSTKFEIALMFYQNHVLENDPRQAVVDARKYAARRTATAKEFTSWLTSPEADRPVRVGWVSPDFKSHPVGRFLDAVLHQIDPARVEMYAYSQENRPGDPVYESIRKAIPRWCKVEEMSDEELAHRIRRDRIDVLVDLTGHTANNRLGVFAFKPAPVAVTWLGYFATTGYDAIDYVLCNRWLVPENEEDQWVEKPWRLEDTHWCYTEPKGNIPVVDTPALAGTPFTFGSYNNFEKINDATMETWARCVKAVPNSRLLLRSSLQSGFQEARLKEGFAALGLTEEQVIIESAGKNYEEHLQSYGMLDIALDPFPYNGGTTTTESLYMGVPVLTLRGDRFVAHLAETNLQSAGLADWIAMDRDDFVAIAQRWAGDLPALNALRLGLRERVLASRLFDAKRFARDLEDAFQGMWHKWRDAQKGEAA